MANVKRVAAVRNRIQPDIAVFTTPANVTEESALAFNDALVKWHQDSNNAGKPILIHIACNGGNIEDGVAIRNTIILLQSWGHLVYGRINGRAWSCSTWIFQACDVRIVGNGATLMFHEPKSTFSGRLTEFKTHVAQTEAILKRTLRMLLCKAKVDSAYVRQRIAGRDWCIEGPEAVRLGLADKYERVRIGKRSR